MAGVGDTCEQETCCLLCRLPEVRLVRAPGTLSAQDFRQDSAFTAHKQARRSQAVVSTVLQDKITQAELGAPSNTSKTDEEKH